MRWEKYETKLIRLAAKQILKGASYYSQVLYLKVMLKRSWGSVRSKMKREVKKLRDGREK